MLGFIKHGVNLLADADKGPVEDAVREIVTVLKWGATMVLTVAAVIFVYFAITHAIKLAAAADENDRKKIVKSLIAMVVGIAICGIAAGLMPILFEYFAEVI